MRKMIRRANIASLATQYNEQGAEGEALTIPEDLTTLSADELAELSNSAADAFDALYGDGSASLTDEEFAALSSLTEGIESINAEHDRRADAAAERAEQVEALAARVRGNEEPADGEGTEDDEDDEDEGKPKKETAAAETAPVEPVEPAEGAEAPAESVTASATPRGPISIPVTSARRRQATPTPPVETASIRDALVASAEAPAIHSGQGIDWAEAGELLNHRLGSFNHRQFQSAHDSGRAIREQGALISIKRNVPAELTITENSQEHVDAILDRATSETQLAGGSLVAAGGWCAPSETMYDLLELESDDGLLSIPEVGISRGGVSFTRGPDFASIFKDFTGFHFTEEEDIEGRYAAGATPDAPKVVGAKPSHRLECPDFEEHRLDVDGISVTAGLLQAKGYPELLARTLRGVAIAHKHRMNGRLLADMQVGSTAVTMPTGQIGATAPLLTSIELQVEHYKYTHRLRRNTTLEAVFPFWVRGVVRSDLSRRNGVDLINVTDAQISAWFTQRGINAQFVYNWQALEGTAATGFTQWPTSVTFLLYAAGTWFRGVGDLISIDTLYDSVNLHHNDFTALFTEEASFVARRGHDSRAVTVGLDAPGAAAADREIAWNGKAAA